MINFKKLKSQIKPFKPEAKHKGYIFIATDEQIANGGFTVAKVGSKQSLIDCMAFYIKKEPDVWADLIL